MSSVRQTILTAMIAVLAFVGVVALPLATAYASPGDEINKGLNAAGKADKCKNSDCTLGGNIRNITNILLFLIGAVSVIMIILGGIRYVLANGDSSQITSAKNTIMYAVIGLVVALLAFAIVSFVTSQFIK